jgi:hypothetical protein
MPQAQRKSEGYRDEARAAALEQASDHLIEARRATDLAEASSLRLFVNMALIEAATLLGRIGGRGRDRH